MNKLIHLSCETKTTCNKNETVLSLGKSYGSEEKG